MRSAPGRDREAGVSENRQNQDTKRTFHLWSPRRAPGEKLKPFVESAKGIRRGSLAYSVCSTVCAGLPALWTGLLVRSGSALVATPSELCRQHNSLAPKIQVFLKIHRVVAGSFKQGLREHATRCRRSALGTRPRLHIFNTLGVNPAEGFAALGRSWVRKG
jgi:hypothetical protein